VGWITTRPLQSEGTNGVAKDEVHTALYIGNTGSRSRCPGHREDGETASRQQGLSVCGRTEKKPQTSTLRRDKHFQERSAELQIPPLRYAPVGMTKERVALPFKLDAAEDEQQVPISASLRAGSPLRYPDKRARYGAPVDCLPLWLENREILICCFLGLEPATSAVTAERKRVTYWNQGERDRSISPARDRLTALPLAFGSGGLSSIRYGLCAPVKLSERAASHPHDAGCNSTVQQARKARP
jgi:hypothetical protein